MFSVGVRRAIRLERLPEQYLHTYRSLRWLPSGWSSNLFIKSAINNCIKSSQLQTVLRRSTINDSIGVTTVALRGLTSSAPTAVKKKMSKLTEEQRQKTLQPLLSNGWSMVNGRDAIYKEYTFRDFNEAFTFMSGVALVAEKINHHPEWLNVYNKIQVTLSTHDIGGLSERDVRVATFMDSRAKLFK